MSIHVALHHRTTYRYERAVSLGPQSVRLRPAPHCRSRVLAYSLKVLPQPHFLNWQQDPQANFVARLVFPERTRELSIEVDVLVEMAAQNPFDFFLEPSVENWPFEYDESLREELAPYRRALGASPLLDAYLEQDVSREPRGTNELLVSLNQELCRRIDYRVRLEPGLQTPDETLAKRSGSCRDSGWLLVQLLRRLGFAARFVSGYLIQLTADTKPIEGPEGPTTDFVDLHAWCEVYLPGAGWIGFDPTSGLLAGEGHLPLACTAEPSLAAPVSGLVDRCETRFEHFMSVTRVLEVPRVTRPYDDEQWARILELGQSIDADLERQDVRLTMGGEPTFIASEDLDADEWNTAALGPTKKRRALELYRRIKARHAPNGLSHFGQGKWYPGEPLPRWSLNLFWRRDGVPLWKDLALLSDPEQQGGADGELARRVLSSIATGLGVDPGCAFPAYEDVYYYLWRERRLPDDVDPLDSRLADPLERERLQRLFSDGLERVTGYVLPLESSEEAPGFCSEPWRFRGRRCYLVPGDSPLGLRLPLDSLPWRNGEHGETGGGVRTALSVEPRGGVLAVFLPPVKRFEDFIALVSAIEASARQHSVPVLIDGYPPPRDARLVQLSVTPDPGVIEVNVQPAASWKELVDHTTELYEDARLSRLAAEKFALDGRHTGTGGGNHVVLGGATPEDSPFLRRPDLLRSLIGYFHQHPSLSYLFSGQFIGPTSQAPRVDEARNDSLFELEIAFRELTRKLGEAEQVGSVPAWLVDRSFRDLLVDVTGNTHRAEFCIDKLFSPDTASGRLGLVELRGFEMPPHARMSLTQQLLLRALVARFWKTPFVPHRLTRWGSELHDRFMLPFFVWQDFADVISELSDAGYTLSSSWFLPHFEFRFPSAGDFSTRGMDIELRSALEPWHVMGEDVTSGGTARYVDSSLERVQVKVTGMAPDRFAITCNGHGLPLRSTGKVGEYVAGVRFRAWQPPRCLHPHIGVHAPLVFDLVDRWTKRSLGGCEYHVAHPGGRAHDTRPVNALEAEGRRRARFFRTGHTPGPLDAKPAPESPDFPFTLDLRRV